MTGLYYTENAIYPPNPGLNARMLLITELISLFSTVSSPAFRLGQILYI